MKFNCPIQFPVLVNGAKVTAFFDEQIGRGVQSMLHIYFSDGFEDYFFHPESGGLYGTKPGVQAYENALRRESNILVQLNPNRFYHTFQETVDGILTNIWIQETGTSPDERSYAVYYNNMFRFEVKKEKGNWTANSRDAPIKEINPLIAQKVMHALDILL